MSSISIISSNNNPKKIDFQLMNTSDIYKGIIKIKEFVE